MHSGHESTDLAELAIFLLNVLTGMSCKIHEVSLLTSWHTKKSKLKCSASFGIVLGENTCRQSGVVRHLEDVL